MNGPNILMCEACKGRYAKHLVVKIARATYTEDNVNILWEKPVCSHAEKLVLAELQRLFPPPHTEAKPVTIH